MGLFYPLPHVDTFNTSEFVFFTTFLPLGCLHGVPYLESNNSSFIETEHLFFFQQSALLRAQTDKDKIETDLLKQQEKVSILENQVQKTQKERENLQAEMEMLLDRINKLSEHLDKARVSQKCCSVNC